MNAGRGQTVVDRLQAAIHTIDGSEMAKIVCKASTHEMAGPKQKHLTHLVNMSRAPNINQPELINNLILRTKEKSWVVVLKALCTMHNLMIYGSEKVFQVTAARPMLFNLEQFNDTSPMGYDMSMFIRKYSCYLNQRAGAYRSMACDFCKMNNKNKEWSKKDDEKLIEGVSTLQDLLTNLTSLRKTSLNNPVANSAFEHMYKDLIKMYASYNEAMINIMERLTKMKVNNAKAALNVFRKFLEHMETFKEFFELAQSIGLSNQDIPDLSKGPAKLLPMFESHISDLENGNVTIENNITSPHKVASPVNNGHLSIQEQALRDEEAALAKFAKSKSPNVNQPTVPAISAPNRLPPPSTTQQAFLIKQQNQSSAVIKPPPPTDYSADLLSLDFTNNNLMQTTNNNNIQSNKQNLDMFAFDPLGLSSNNDIIQNSNNNQMLDMNNFQNVNTTTNQNNINENVMGDIFSQGNAQMANNPFSMAPLPNNNAENNVNNNPFSNPFANGLQPQQASLTENFTPQNQNSQNQTSANGFDSDPFAQFLQPNTNNQLNTNNNFQNSSNTLNNPNNNKNLIDSTQSKSGAMFGPNLDATLNNLMKDFNLTPNAGNRSTQNNPNNPFAGF